jgi:hypothetical protein
MVHGILVVAALGCAAMVKKNHNDTMRKKTQKGGRGLYLVALLFFMLCSMQMKLHPSSKLLPLFLLDTP